MKIAVLGNSHLSALKLAWDEMAQDYPEITLVFFGARNRLMSNLKAEGNCLIPTNDQIKQALSFTSNGLEIIDFQQFDIVLLDGLFSGIFFLLGQILNNHHIYHPQQKTKKIISKACFKQLCHDRLEESLLFQLAMLTRQVTSIPMFITPEPFPSHACVLTESRKWQFLQSNDWQTIRDVYYLELPKLCEKVQATFLPQPENTVIDMIFSKPMYSEGSVRLLPGLDTSHPESDYIHMNKEFGKEILVSFFNAIKNSEC